ncbi:acyl-CoA thioesterase II [Aerobium aerolatum]|uniref:Acyl-CoA thioesterase 2 n=1 Tax=Aquamicrobium aerolatum DSM 21857 TaxID=1121003 RepID=A0A1I3IYP1_9HYPH|nr:acyl-CoA thioesterase II [Aquamicrobium aerolatum]SFI52958.1 acyl-CoA thioesterase-2 [Aquamicrobium aerolatum DSM 21857]
MTQAMQELLDILDLEQLEHNLYRGRSHKVGWQRVFGGQVIGQALVAAQRTVDDSRAVHSLHCYFMRPGDPQVPIIYQVDRLRDGGSFTTRRVTAIQHGHAIFSLESSFQVVEDGLEHQMPMPLDVPDPENLPTQVQLLEQTGHPVPDAVRKFWSRERPLDIRPVNTEHYTSTDKLPPRQNVWLRTVGPVPDNSRLQAAILAYLSDMTLLETTTFAHGKVGFDPQIQMASLDHAMWFHRPHKLDDWLLYTQDSPTTIGARGLARGFLYARDGTLIASTAQEGLVRLRTQPKK